MTDRELIAQAEALSSVIDSVENCPILYSDTIRSRRVNRDDLWAITTEQLLYLRQLVRLFRAQAEQPAEPQPSNNESFNWSAFAEQPAEQGEPVAQVVSSGRWEMPCLQWMSADHSFRAPIGAELYAHPDPRIAALEKALKELVSYTKACEGMLNASPAGQVLAAEAALGGP